MEETSGQINECLNYDIEGSVPESNTVKRQYSDAFDDVISISSDNDSDCIVWDVSDVELDENEQYWEEIRRDWYKGNVSSYIETVPGKVYPTYSLILKLGTKQLQRMIRSNSDSAGEIITPSDIRPFSLCIKTLKQSLEKEKFSLTVYKPLRCLLYMPPEKAKIIQLKNTTVDCGVYQEERVQFCSLDLRYFLVDKSGQEVQKTARKAAPKKKHRKLFNVKYDHFDIPPVREVRYVDRKKEKTHIEFSATSLFIGGRIDETDLDDDNDGSECDQDNNLTFSSEDSDIPVSPEGSVSNPQEDQYFTTENNCTNDGGNSEDDINLDIDSIEEICQQMISTDLCVVTQPAVQEVNCLFRLFGNNFPVPHYDDFVQIESTLNELKLSTHLQEKYAYYNLCTAASLFAEGKNLEGEKLYEYGTKLLTKINLHKTLESELGTSDEENAGASDIPTEEEFRESGIDDVTKKTKQMPVFKFECTECDRKFVKEIDLRSHMWNHENPDNFQFKCSFCDKKFRSQRSYDLHNVFHAKGNKYVKCKECDCKFETLNQLESHNVSHREICLYKCIYCQSRFKFKNTCTLHERDCITKQRYKCTVCNKEYKSLNVMRAHRSRDHK